MAIPGKHGRKNLTDLFARDMEERLRPLLEFCEKNEQVQANSIEGNLEEIRSLMSFPWEEDPGFPSLDSRAKAWLSPFLQAWEDLSAGKESIETLSATIPTMYQKRPTKIRSLREFSYYVGEALSSLEGLKRASREIKVLQSTREKIQDTVQKAIQYFDSSPEEGLEFVRTSLYKIVKEFTDEFGMSAAPGEPKKLMEWRYSVFDPQEFLRAWENYDLHRLDITAFNPYLSEIADELSRLGIWRWLKPEDWKEKIFSFLTSGRYYIISFRELSTLLLLGVPLPIETEFQDGYVEIPFESSIRYVEASLVRDDLDTCLGPRFLEFARDMAPLLLLEDDARRVLEWLRSIPVDSEEKNSFAELASGYEVIPVAYDEQELLDLFCVSVARSIRSFYFGKASNVVMRGKDRHTVTLFPSPQEIVERLGSVKEFSDPFPYGWHQIGPIWHIQSDQILDRIEQYLDQARPFWKQSMLWFKTNLPTRLLKQPGHFLTQWDKIVSEVNDGLEGIDLERRLAEFVASILWSEEQSGLTPTMPTLGLLFQNDFVPEWARRFSLPYRKEVDDLREKYFTGKLTQRTSQLILKSASAEEFDMPRFLLRILSMWEKFLRGHLESLEGIDF